MDRLSALPQHHSSKNNGSPNRSPALPHSPSFSSSPFLNSPRSHRSQYSTPTLLTPSFTTPSLGSSPSPSPSIPPKSVFSNDGTGLGLGIADDLSSVGQGGFKRKDSYRRSRRNPFRLNIYTLALFNVLTLGYWRYQDGKSIPIDRVTRFVNKHLETRSTPQVPIVDFSSAQISQQALHHDSHQHTQKKFRAFGDNSASGAATTEGKSELLLDQARYRDAITTPLGLSNSLQTCEVCLLNPNDPLCEYGYDNIKMSRAYSGSGYRVRRFLEKALRGEVVKIGIIGGSVTAGHGLWEKPKWSVVFFEAFQKAFPKAQIYDGAAPAQGSSFFSYCFPALLPKDLDLYIVELDINNEAIDRTFGEDDALFRALLGLPQEPAVVRAAVLALSFPNMALGHVSSLLMSQYFDVPVVSLRNILFPHALIHPNATEQFFGVLPDGKTSDLRHIGWMAHQALGDLLTLYFREMVCETRRRIESTVPQAKGVWPRNDIQGYIPRQYIWESFNETSIVPPVTSQCMFGSSPLQPLVPIPDPQYTTPGAWNREEWNGKVAIGSHVPGTKVGFSFEGTKLGLFIWKTSGIRNGVKNKEMPGRAKCWVDDDVERGVDIDAWYDDIASRSIWHAVRDDLKFGLHIVSCQIMEESTTEGHDFRILGVASQ